MKKLYLVQLPGMGEGQFVWRLVIFAQSECIDLCSVQCHKATYFTYERLECVLILYMTLSTVSTHRQHISDARV